MKKICCLFFILLPLFAVAQSCSDLGGESGWGPWQARKGTISQAGVVAWGATAPPTAPQFTITSGSDKDGCTPGTASGSPELRLVCPDFGNASLRLGQYRTSGNGGGCLGPGASAAGCTEEIRTTFTVAASDTTFIYAYAVVLENPIAPAPVHLPAQAPRAEIYMLDQNGDTVPCSHRTYRGDVGGGMPPGMYNAAVSCPGPNSTLDVAYFPWTTVGINLTAYIGQVLTIVIVNADCGLGAHFCHSYWDFKCPQLSPDSIAYCVGQTVGLMKPDLTNNSLSIFPNPSNGIFTISSSEKILGIEITNILGEKTYSFRTSSLVNQSMQIDLAKEQNGIYFLQIKTEKGLRREKLILSR